MKKITEKRLAEIKAFKNTDFSDAPELTDELLAHKNKTTERHGVQHGGHGGKWEIRLPPNWLRV